MSAQASGAGAGAEVGAEGGCGAKTSPPLPPPPHAVTSIPEKTAKVAGRSCFNSFELLKMSPS
jgi:hypothetical protein